MVMRRRHPCLVVDVGENLESQVGILVQHLQAARHALAAVLLDEVLVGEQALEVQRELPPGPSGPGSRLRMARQSDTN